MHNEHTMLTGLFHEWLRFKYPSWVTHTTNNGVVKLGFGDRQGSLIPR